LATCIAISLVSEETLRRKRKKLRSMATTSQAKKGAKPAPPQYVNLIDRKPILGERNPARAGMSRLQRLKEPFFKRTTGPLLMMLAKPLKAMENREAWPEWVKNMPGPHQDMSVAQAFSLWQDSQAHGDNHLLILEWAEKYGIPNGSGGNICYPSLSGGWDKGVGLTWNMLVNNPVDHSVIGTDNLRKSVSHDLAPYQRHILGQYDTDTWRRQRFYAMEAMAPMSSFEPKLNQFEKQAKNLVQRIKRGDESTHFYSSASPHKSYNIHELLADTAFRILAITLFGEDEDYVAENSRRVRWAMHKADKSNKEADKITNEWIDRLIRTKEQRIPKGEVPKSVLDPQEGATVGPLLTRLVETQNLDNWKEQERSMRDNIWLLTLAGHDTTAATMSWCLYELARNPAHMEKAQAEVDAFFTQIEKEGRDGMTYKDFHSLTFLTKCMNETLRKWNAVSYGTRRELEQDYELKSKNGLKQVVPKGTNVQLPNYCNHRRDDLWDGNADEWDPERWTDIFADHGSVNFGDASEGPITFSGRNPQSLRFHPFTRGPRDCFGKNFAQSEMRCIIPYLIHHFDFKLAEPTRALGMNPETEHQLGFELLGILKPREGLWLHALPRKIKTSRL
jgi:cytochrome P450